MNDLISENMQSDRSKSIALVTGASRGIGRAIALRLAQSGIKVIGSATTMDGATAITQYLSVYDGAGIKLNVTDKLAIDEAVNFIKIHYGEITILVNNAGVTKDNLLIRMKDDEWDEVLDTNLKAVFLLTKAVIRGMTKMRFGRIVNLSSIVGFTGNPGQTNYASSKAGLIGFSKSLAQELGSRNITVNCVAPGFIATDMTDRLPLEVRESYLKNIALKRFGSVEEVAACVDFLVSDAASYLTGTTLHVDGGLY